MNYSTVVLGGWVLFGAIYYFIRGRKRYNGPVIELAGVSRVATKP